MLEMAFQAPHIGVNEAAEILEDAKKGVRWLIDMSAQSISARKAWEIFDRLIRLVAPKVRWSVFDLPTEAPVPPGYNWRRFNSDLQPEYAGSTAWHQPRVPADGAYLQGPTMIPIPPQPSLLPYPPSYGELQFASNPLDPIMAIQRFSAIGGAHGQYDESWAHLFDTTPETQEQPIMVDATMLQMGAGIECEIGMGVETGMALGEGSQIRTAVASTSYEHSYPDLQGYGTYDSGFGQGGFRGG